MEQKSRTILTDDMVLYMKTLKNPCANTKLLRAINTFNKVARYKINA